MDSKHIFTENLGVDIKIYAPRLCFLLSGSFFFAKQQLLPFWAVHGRSDGRRGQPLCLGVQLVCGKLKAFFKVWDLRMGCIKV
jgi:hypothetical protein